MTTIAAHLRRSRRAGGFTLIELLISIAIVLVLMSGVVQVFKYASDAVGTSLAVGEVTRAQRALLIQFQLDCAGLNQDVVSTPCILLDSQQNDPTVAGPNTQATPGVMYLNKADEALGSPAYPAFPQLADKQFRFDQFSFLSRGAFTRQTGNDGQYGSSLASGWGRVWFGHLWEPSNSFDGSGNPVYVDPTTTTPTYPGLVTAAANPNNFYASQWTLGRVVTLISPKNYPYGTTPTDVAQGTTLQAFYGYGGTYPEKAVGLQPLSFGSPAYIPSGVATIAPTPGPIQSYRYDLAAVVSPNNDPFLDVYYPALNSTVAATFVPTWWNPIFPPASATQSLNYRFQGNSYPVRALTSVKVASASPALVAGCVQFYVEFAGDFLTQNATTGLVTTPGLTPDGQTDFYVDASGVRHTRWYGLYRSTNGNRVTSGSSPPAGSALVNISTAGNNPDVVPVSTFTGGTVAFERLLTANHYVCGWDATPTTATNTIAVVPRPSMFRITIQMTDAAGRLGSGQTFQYIVPVANTANGY